MMHRRSNGEGDGAACINKNDAVYARMRTGVDVLSSRSGGGCVDGGGGE